VTTFPTHPDARLAAMLRQFQTRMTLLEQRTAVLDGVPVQALIGMVDPDYTSGDPMVVLPGAADPSGPYLCLASYTPVASDLVLMIPTGDTYVVAGKLV
jgi:hypothetical protein